MKKLLLSITVLTMNQLAIAQSITLVPNNPAVPTKGTVVFNNAANLLQYWNGSAWIPITNAATATGWAAVGNNINNANTGNVGIGTNTPNAAFNVAASKTVLFGADSTNVGNKLIWYPTKGAFRVGSDFNTIPWTYGNIGLYSVAMGFGTAATGNYSNAMGFFTTANGYASTAMGYNSTANGRNSTAMGSVTSATGAYSTAMGSVTNATGESSTAMGSVTDATGTCSTAMGYFTTANGDFSTAMGLFNVGLTTTFLEIGNGDGNNHSNLLSVFKNGKVGIGTLTPNAPLHIGSSSAANETTTRYFSYGTGSSVGVLPNGTYNISLLTDYDIVTKNSFVSAQTVTTSDARIKKIIGLSNNHQDLHTLRQIQITDYHYKDAVTWGNRVFKKVIAQQVEEVYPQAVRRQKSVIADIYELAERVQYNEPKKELTVIMSQGYGLKTGDKVELVDSRQGKVLAEITSVSGNGFTVSNWLLTTDKIFVFGREVDDFRVVDYEAISMLGISAIQQLATEVDSLKKQLSEMDTLKKRLDALEASLSPTPSGK